MKKNLPGRIMVFCLVFVSGCISSPKYFTRNIAALPAELKGNFEDDYGISYHISDSLWTQAPGIKYHIVHNDLSGSYLIARNDENNPGDKGLYTRIDYMQFENMDPFFWGFCLTVYKAHSVEEAKQAATSDRANPKTGCNGYPFSRMKRQ